MADKAVEQALRGIAEQLSTAMKKDQPGIFNKDFWAGRMLELAMRDPAFKIEMFRFIDVFAILKTPEQIAQHLQEYFLRPGQNFPTFIQWSIKGLGSSIGQKLGGSTIASQITDMAKKFIAGETTSDALTNLGSLRREHVGFTLDLLGEAAVSENESEIYLHRYTEAIEQLADAAKTWQESPLLDHDSLGNIPKVNVSIKVSSLYSAIDPLAFDHAIAILYRRLLKLLLQARALNVFVNFDLEQYELKELTFELFRRLRMAPELRGYPHLGFVIQAYQKDSLADAEAWVKFAKSQKEPFTIRLVKGAYWDYETIFAQQKNWPSPVFQRKNETDANFENIAEILLEAFPHVRVAIASHNLRSIAHAMAYAERRKLRQGSYELQMLYGMAEPIRRALIARGERVRVYAPVGNLLIGMAYLVRRLLENTSNESFLRQRFVETKNLDELLLSPKPAPKNEIQAPQKNLQSPFENEPPRDFSDPAVRKQWQTALKMVHGKFPLAIPTVVGGNSSLTMATTIKRENPSNPAEIVAEIHYAHLDEVNQAVALANAASVSWRDRSVHERAQILLNAAARLREERDTLSALMLFEVGKSPREADADLCETIDFCEYYAREAVSLLSPKKLGTLAGEANEQIYEPRGVSAIIAPWNFPSAILTGMTVAALVTGNTAIMKPAEQSTAIGFRIFEILRQAGVPADVLHFLPGSGEEIGAALCEHPDVQIIAFTGSRPVGLQILKHTAELKPKQNHLKKVILELGGKNAIIVDSDADLDEAVLGIRHSAFSFQGQKCSACSRVIVLADRYDEFIHRLVEATRTLLLGPPERFEHTLGPVVDREAYERIKNTIANASKRFQRVCGDDAVNSIGYYIPATIFVDVDPQDKLAQEEIFGPVLTVHKARDFSEALAIANHTDCALTGGVFSRSPENLARARREFHVGNLYLNRGITGAFVSRQPFGGFKLSGIGSKAGGADYLQQFIETRVITENTMRRGFAPDSEQSG